MHGGLDAGSLRGVRGTGTAWMGDLEGRVGGRKHSGGLVVARRTSGIPAARGQRTASCYGGRRMILIWC